VQAGLGITVRTRIGMPENLRVVGNLLPPLGNLGITLEQITANGEDNSAQRMVEQLMVDALSGVTGH